MEISAAKVKELREQTGAGVLDCKRSLELNEGDFEKAKAYLRAKGLAAAEKRAEREVREGLIGSYVHTGSRVAALVEVNCETDFVARTDQFVCLARELAMHVVAMSPKYVSADQVPADLIENKKRAFREELLASGKPAGVIDEAVQGRLDKFFAETCLLSQPFIKDESITVGDLIKNTNAQVKENIVVRRFSRFEVGEEL